MRGTIAAFPNYEPYTTSQLLTAYTAGPERVRTAIAGLTEQELRARPRGRGTWSAHEIVIHTADSELQGTYRMRKVWAEPGADLPGYDQDAWATRIGYEKQSATARATALDVLTLLRTWMLPLLEGASGGDWAKSGTHPEYGPLTMRDLLALYADHTERHVAQILHVRELLGKPLDLPLLLPQRLY